jgi:hypothetical protein
MTTKKKIQCCARGLAIGILVPAAAVYVTGKKLKRFASEVADESLTLSMHWVKQTEETCMEVAGIVKAEFKDVAQLTRTWNGLDDEPPLPRSLGAAAANDLNVTGKDGLLPILSSWRVMVGALAGAIAGACYLYPLIVLGALQGAFYGMLGGLAFTLYGAIHGAAGILHAFGKLVHYISEWMEPNPTPTSLGAEAANDKQVEVGTGYFDQKIAKVWIHVKNNRLFYGVVVSAVLSIMVLNFPWASPVVGYYSATVLFLLTNTLNMVSKDLSSLYRQQLPGIDDMIDKSEDGWVALSHGPNRTYIARFSPKTT